MRPLHLRIRAFGSYPEAEQVDFGALAELGLFCVTGPTGSGKSTIFDAMTFALFGEVAGDRQVRDMRSQHAAPGVATEVVFEFEVDGHRWRVMRAPAQEVPKSRGSGSTVKAASASLAEFADGQWQPVASQATAVTARCVDLLGLSAEQFQQVVLLPQGAFADFLLAKTVDRQELLRRLFGSHLYVRAVEALKTEAEELHRQLDGVQADAQRHRRNAVTAVQQLAELLEVAPVDALADDADEAAIEAAAAALAPARQAQAAQAHEARRAAAQARDAASRASDEATRFQQAAALTAEQAELRSQAPAMLHHLERVEAARRAAPVVAASADTADAEHTFRQASTQHDDVVHRLRQLAAPLGVDTGATPAAAGVWFTRHRAELESAQTLLEEASVAAEHAQQAARQLHTATAEVQRRSADHARLLHEVELTEAQHREAAHRAAGLVAARAAAATAAERLAQRQALDQAVQQLIGAEQDATAAVATETHLFQQFIGDTAPRLAATLVPGEACPVCGSAQHPAPAQAHSRAESVGSEALDAARRASDAARAVVARLIERVAALREALGAAAGEPVEAAAAAASATQVALDAAETADVERLRLAAECAQQQTALGEAAEALAAATTAESTRRAMAQEADERHRAATERAAGIDEGEVRASLALLDQLEPLVASWSAAADRVIAAEGVRRSAAERLAGALALSGFEHVEQAVAVALDHAEVQRLTAVASEHHTRSAAVDAQLAQLVALGVPMECPDAESAQRTARLLEQQSAALERTSTQVEQRSSDLVAALTEARSITDGSAELRYRCEMVDHVRAVCNGTAGRRIGLETWVLAAELDRVTAAATEHLQRMSHGRYALLRTTDAERAGQRTGLELAVFDAHTGQSRPPVSLSGGERFQASLALALGLADVVSQGGSGSGRVFEALFVDEGFGSLDPEALDDAIEALGHLRASGRMVGAITHVEAMKAQLPTGIEVRRRPAGGGSTIVQPGAHR